MNLYCSASSQNGSCTTVEISGSLPDGSVEDMGRQASTHAIIHAGENDMDVHSFLADMLMTHMQYHQALFGSSWPNLLTAYAINGVP